ncbi:ankyrin repeat domain-containing 27 isoform X2 [Labeo rohita]|uniref:Ankyrin repeat domain-containing 27 isoform X2 n=1 Tax=Labeo rohita TaxID=84645 RepID=A0A498NGQ6_LABRO|nr:ankyrin repeat domain-containing 27 isoform X2 [Labeo rohita]
MSRTCFITGFVIELECGTHMAVYDENILKNPFYQALEKHRPDLCSRVAELHGIILVPCCGSLPAGSITASQFDGYVLRPAEQGYQTLDGKEVSIDNNQVRLGAGFPNPTSVPVLFEETFYNEKEQAYSILCIARPFDSDHSPEELSTVSAPYCLKNIEDVREFLGRHAEKLDKFVAAFCHSFKEQERKGLRHQIKILARQEIQMTLLKQAVEMYIHHGIHDLLFSYVGTLEASRDAAFNKTTRSLQDLQQKELGVKSEFRMANLSYIKNFRFRKSSKDELSYCLTSFEAAVEYISQGNLTQSALGSGDRLSFRQKVDLLSQNATPIDRLFEHIVSGNEAEVKRLLSESENEEDGRKLCHPLCSCDACDRHISGRLNDPSIVTPFSRDDRGYTPLHVAAVCGQSLLIDVLVSKGAVVNATDYHALTPLHLSCQKGFQGVTLLLLHYKANTDAQDNNGNTPLHLACMYGHEDCVKALLYFDLHSCRLNVQNDKGDTPLHIAARWGYEGIMEVLLENGASTLIHNKAKETPLHCALNSKILSLLERTHNDCSKRESGFESPSRSPQPSDCSSRRSSMSSMSSLSVEATPPETERVRHKEVEKLLRAVADGDVQMKTSHLQPDGVGVNSSSADGFTPLHVAALHGHTALVSLFTRHDANINARNNQSATPLHLACQNSQIQVVSALLECNAKLNKKDQYGNTPLILTCLKGNLEIATILLESGALVNLTNNHGNTGLHEAVRGGHVQLVELLLHRGALVHMRNKRQRTALDCAHETAGKNTEIQRLLQKAYADSPDIHPVKHSRGTEGTVAVYEKLFALNRSQRRTDRAATTIGVLDQTADGHSDRRKLTRGETVDSSSPFCHPQSPHAQSRSLTRCHTISQDLTQHSLHVPCDPEPSPEPQQPNGDSALGADVQEEDAQSRGSDVEIAATEMDNVVL